MTRIVFFVEAPFNERDYNRFGIEILEENGIEVEVWDFSPFLQPRIHQHGTVPDPIRYGGYRQFQTQKEGLAAVSKLTRPCWIVCLVPYRYESFPIYRWLSKAKLRYCVFVASVVPEIDASQGWFNTVCKLRRSTPAAVFRRSVFPRIPFRYLGLRPATLLLAGGAQSVRYSSLVGRETEILWAHALDYDLYLKEKDGPIQVDTKMGVFLDEYLPYHRDFRAMGVSPPASAEEYYPTLRKFFDFVEGEYGVRIVIAAHPRSRYEDHCDYFGGRPVVRGQTAALVRRSGFTVAHASHSIRFAVLFNKPVLFVTTNEIQQNAVKAGEVEVMARWLNKTPINLNEPINIDWEKELTVDQAGYARYREAYIKRCGSPEEPFWQIFAKRARVLEWERSGVI